MPNFQMGQSIQRHCDLLIFQNGHHQHLDFEYRKILLADGVQLRGLSHITAPNFVKIGPFIAAILIFEFAKFYWLTWSGGWNCITAKFSQNRFICCEDIVIFLFFNMATAAILDF